MNRSRFLFLCNFFLKQRHMGGLRNRVFHPSIHSCFVIFAIRNNLTCCIAVYCSYRNQSNLNLAKYMQFILALLPSCLLFAHRSFFICVLHPKVLLRQVHSHNLSVIIMLYLIVCHIFIAINKKNNFFDASQIARYCRNIFERYDGCI